jgi:hypothetical protein
MNTNIQHEGTVDVQSSTIVSDNTVEISTENLLSSKLQAFDGIKRVSILEHLCSESTRLKNVYSINGKHFLVLVKESGDVPLSFSSLRLNYGKGKYFNPNTEYQRNPQKHSESNRRAILLSILSREGVGQLLLVKKLDNTYDIIDGRQRTEIVNAFVTGVLKLTGKWAKEFWKLFANQSFLFKENISETDGRLIVNKLLKSLQDKKTPKVDFTKLPPFIQNHILDTYSLHGKVVTTEVFDLEKSTQIPWDSPNYKEIEVKNAITRKFIDVNLYKAEISTEDILWGSGEDCILTIRNFLDTKPTMATLFGIKLEDIDCDGVRLLDATDEVREFMIQLSLSHMFYQNTEEKREDGKKLGLDWASSGKKLQKLILEGLGGTFTDRTIDIHEKMVLWFEKGLFQGTYVEGEEDKNLYIPSELNDSRVDVLRKLYFTTMLFVTEFINEKKGDGYLIAGKPTYKFFKLMEKISIYLTIGKIFNLKDLTEFNQQYGIPQVYLREDLPLLKYGLLKEFVSKEIFEDTTISQLLTKVGELNTSMSGRAVDYHKTIKKLIRYAETKI